MKSDYTEIRYIHTDTCNESSENLLIATFLHVLLISHNKDPNFTAVPALLPGEQVGHQESQALKEKTQEGLAKDGLHYKTIWHVTVLHCF